MDFGYVRNVDNIDFSLPKTPERSWDVLKKIPSQQKLSSYLGLPIWSNKEWIGKIYPKKTPAKDYLHLYSRQFNSIELNTTHYAVPDMHTLNSWKQATPSGFKFCPKFPQEISHHRVLRNCGELGRNFYERLSLLGPERLGLFFLQLPPHFTLKELPVLKKFVSELIPAMPLAVEFRHPTWFKNQNLVPEAAEFLENKNISTVITDTAGRRDVAHQQLTNSRVLVRFLANSLHTSDYSRTDKWAERIAMWKDAGLTELYFFIHETNTSLHLELANYAVDRFNDKAKLGLKKWQGVEETPPQQPQLDLFG